MNKLLVKTIIYISIVITSYNAYAGFEIIAEALETIHKIKKMLSSLKNIDEKLREMKNFDKFNRHILIKQGNSLTKFLSRNSTNYNKYRKKLLNNSYNIRDKFIKSKAQSLTNKDLFFYSPITTNQLNTLANQANLNLPKEYKERIIKRNSHYASYEFNKQKYRTRATKLDAIQNKINKSREHLQILSKEDNNLLAAIHNLCEQNDIIMNQNQKTIEILNELSSTKENIFTQAISNQNLASEKNIKQIAATIKKLNNYTK